MEKSNWTILWWIIGFLIFISWLSGPSNSNPYDTCYDADPTQWTEMVCD